jgi:hypothetical protein
VIAWFGTIFGVDGRSAVGTAAADALPAIENVNPAAPNIGTAFATCFFFEAFVLGIVASSIPCKKKMFRVPQRDSSACKGATQGWLRAQISTR